MFYPYTVKGVEIPNRIMVSSMDMYSAVDGVPGDFHLVHLGSKALGGAGLVMSEMVCVSAEGRITPGCTGLYTPEQEESWKRIVDFVHTRTHAKIGVQLGHSGRKGSTKLMWEGIDDPLDTGNWDVVAPSALPYGPGSQTPREVTEAELDQIEGQFIAAAKAAARAGFDVLELHCAHGYLLSSFLSPLSNTRTDQHGGSLENRLRFPLRVFDAIRAVWPTERPLSVRISATDWAEGGNNADDAVAIARAFAERGVDIINVSSGQVVKNEKPAYGRSYQTPFADEVGADHDVAVVAEPANQIAHRQRRRSHGGRPPRFDATDYTCRNVIERGFNLTEQWRGLATRYDKLAITYRRRSPTRRHHLDRPLIRHAPVHK
jgi:anthraniloyl-CoA monooxygenase